MVEEWRYMTKRQARENFRRVKRRAGIVEVEEAAPVPISAVPAPSTSTSAAPPVAERVEHPQAAQLVSQALPVVAEAPEPEERQRESGEGEGRKQPRMVKREEEKEAKGRIEKEVRKATAPESPISELLRCVSFHFTWPRSLYLVRGMTAVLIRSHASNGTDRHGNHSWSLPPLELLRLPPPFPALAAMNCSLVLLQLLKRRKRIERGPPVALREDGAGRRRTLRLRHRRTYKRRHPFRRRRHMDKRLIRLEVGIGGWRLRPRMTLTLRSVERLLLPLRYRNLLLPDSRRLLPPRHQPLHPPQLSTIKPSPTSLCSSPANPHPTWLEQPHSCLPRHNRSSIPHKLQRCS